MGATNSQSVHQQGDSLPVLATNHALAAHTAPNNPLRPSSLLLRNITYHRFQEWQTALIQLQRFNGLLWLPRECVWRTECVCSQFGEVQIQYQEGIYTLNDEIQQRAPHQQYFQEHELWYLLFLIITLQFNLSQNGKQQLWNIHPECIVVTTQGAIKVLVELERGQGETDTLREFVPPEEIPLLLMRLIKTTDERVLMRINKEISETFQIGLTLLSAARLASCAALYSRKPLLALDLDQLAHALDLLSRQSRYTEVLTALITNLASFNPADRLSGPELWEWIADHGGEIKSRKAFNFRYLPRKISELVGARMRDRQQGLLRRSQLKMERLGSSQVDSRKSSLSPRRSSAYETSLYQPIHHLGRHPPALPRYRPRDP